MALFPKLIYRFNTIRNDIPANLFAEIDPKIHMKMQGTQNNLEKEEQSRRTHTSQFQNLL